MCVARCGPRAPLLLRKLRRLCSLIWGWTYSGFPGRNMRGYYLISSLAVLSSPLRRIKVSKEKKPRQLIQICIRYQKHTCELERLAPKVRYITTASSRLLLMTNWLIYTVPKSRWYWQIHCEKLWKMSGERKQGLGKFGPLAVSLILTDLMRLSRPR